ncbi:MAG TPA: hypothetical protein VHN99_11900 [Deinococcales bacterium]|nr:hypothetical protein [Deinococcales bacterium]
MLAGIMGYAALLGILWAIVAGGAASRTPEEREQDDQAQRDALAAYRRPGGLR